MNPYSWRSSICNSSQNCRYFASFMFLIMYPQLSTYFSREIVTSFLGETYAYFCQKKKFYSFLFGIIFQFFNYLAECTEAFKTAVKLSDEEYLLGFCFSFPYRKTGINSGYLTNWTKRFNVSGVVGKDVGALLQEAFDKRNVSYVHS